MKFIIDAQLPPSLKSIFIENGFECIHTLDLPNKNNTTDTDIRNYCKSENAVLITKDEDFYYTHLLNESPRKLILIKLGNCSKSLLKEIISNKLQTIINILLIENLIILNNEEV